MRAISTFGRPEAPTPARVIARGENGSRLEQTETGLLVAKSELA